jgi:serine/threonine-protein kinase
VEISSESFLLGSKGKFAMAVQVTLTVTQGSLQGKKMSFSGRALCTVGRSSDCAVRLPDEEQNRVVSQHHCVFDIDPPSIRVWDAGSRNGTYLNGVSIGHGPEPLALHDARYLQWPAFALLDGDEVQVGSTVFRVGAFVSAECAACSGSIAEEEMVDREWKPGVFLCSGCTEKEPAWADRANECMLVG